MAGDGKTARAIAVNGASPARLDETARPSRFASETPSETRKRDVNVAVAEVRSRSKPRSEDRPVAPPKFDADYRPRNFRMSDARLLMTGPGSESDGE